MGFFVSSVILKTIFKVEQLISDTKKILDKLHNIVQYYTEQAITQNTDSSKMTVNLMFEYFCQLEKYLKELVDFYSILVGYIKHNQVTEFDIDTVGLTIARFEYLFNDLRTKVSL